MTTALEILAAIDLALSSVRQKVYYLTDVNCQKTDGENGKEVYFAIAPNMASPHMMFLMHPDNLPAFLGVCSAKGWVAVDQREYWKGKEIAFRKLMEDNARKYEQTFPKTDHKDEPTP